jgi:multidrug efflux pump subunit AcrA (membrane-fusion protein)
VYASSTERWSRTQIEVGADIHERQRIITIPDMSEMKVEIRIHENWVDKVEVRQPAEITISAFPEKQFTGEVIKKSPLADQTNWWRNPDLKAYVTDVKINETDDSLRTGMTAKCEILVNELEDVLMVPVQAVVGRAGEKFCFVKTSRGSEQRRVETGEFNQNFVEIKSGLSEGTRVLLNPPRLSEQEQEVGEV